MSLSHYLHSLEHHAYFLHSIEETFIKLKDYLKEKFNISQSQNPDFFHEKYDTLTIDESRKIREIHEAKSFLADSKRIFVIETNSITHEAQNSLLKIFEEPHEHTHFFLIMPSPHVLLPTLRSRLMIIENRIDREDSEENLKRAQSFLKMSKKERVDFVDRIAEDISEERATKNDALEFLGSLEKVLYEKGIDENKKMLKAILKARDYLPDRSSSVKQLLEFVALS